jgi:hypothetical protein
MITRVMRDARRDLYATRAARSVTAARGAIWRGAYASGALWRDL